jgi:prepilin-type N-terminal cleavage/methylation domain-containing protein
MERTEIKITNPYLTIIRNKKGLTLVEVLIAIVILAIGLLGVAMLQYMAIGGNAFGREMQLATKLGQEFLEVTRSTPFRDATGNINSIFQEGNHPNAFDVAFDPSLQNPAGSGDPSYDSITRAGGMTFTRVWWVLNNCRNITINDPDPNKPVCNPVPPAACTGGSQMNNISAIAVRVCWIDQQGGNHSVTLNGVKWDETATP